MATESETKAAVKTKPQWVLDAIARGSRPLTPEERRRRIAETEELLAARDRLPSIAPDTTEQYIREIRDEADAR